MPDQKVDTRGSDKKEIDINRVPNEYRYLLNEKTEPNETKKKKSDHTEAGQRVLKSKLSRTKSTLDKGWNQDIEFSHDMTIAQIMHQYLTLNAYSRRRLLETNVNRLQESVRAHQESPGQSAGAQPKHRILRAHVGR